MIAFLNAEQIAFYFQFIECPLEPISDSDIFIISENSLFLSLILPTFQIRVQLLCLSICLLILTIAIVSSTPILLEDNDLNIFLKARDKVFRPH